MDTCHANIQLGNLLRIILSEKEQASKKYFEKLFQRSNDGQPSSKGSATGTNDATGEKGVAGGEGAPKKFSPVEALFQKHMRKSLAEFNSYVSALTDKKELALQRIRDVYIERMGRAKAACEAGYPRGSAPREALDAALRPLEVDMNAEIAKVNDMYDVSVSLMLQEFDKVLALLAQSRSFLNHVNFFFSSIWLWPLHQYRSSQSLSLLL